MAAEIAVDRPGEPRICVDDEIVLTHVSSYSACWNTSFNGIPAASLRLLDDACG